DVGVSPARIVKAQLRPLAERRHIVKRLTEIVLRENLGSPIGLRLVDVFLRNMIARTPEQRLVLPTVRKQNLIDRDGGRIKRIGDQPEFGTGGKYAAAPAHLAINILDEPQPNLPQI